MLMFQTVVISSGSWPHWVQHLKLKPLIGQHEWVSCDCVCVCVQPLISSVCWAKKNKNASSVFTTLRHVLIICCQQGNCEIHLLFFLLHHQKRFCFCLMHGEGGLQKIVNHSFPKPNLFCHIRRQLGFQSECFISSKHYFLTRVCLKNISHKVHRTKFTLMWKIWVAGPLLPRVVRQCHWCKLHNESSWLICNL